MKSAYIEIAPEDKYLLRYIYLDEAGTSANEPVTIVAGIIVDADTQWRAAEAKVNELLQEVPEKLQKDFIFHAKDISGSRKNRDIWSDSGRLSLLTNMMAVPRLLNIPIVIGMVRRRFTVPEEFLLKKLKMEQFHHLMAFQLCLAKADMYIRDYAGPNEVASVIVEDLPDMPRYLPIVLKQLREQPLTLLEEYLSPTQEEVASGIVLQNGEISSSRIVDDIHFLGKTKAPLLQVADACAFGFRRYFAKQGNGNLFLESMLGGVLNEADWDGYVNGGTFYSHKKKVHHNNWPS